MALTELQIKHLKPRDKPYRVADSGGLCLEVSPMGSKLWRFRYTYNGKGQMLALGKYPAVSLAAARKLRDQARETRDAGKHLTREKKAAKLRRLVENDNTFAKICRMWLAQKSSGLNAKYAKQSLARMEQHVFPLIGDLPITDITIPDIVHVLEKLAERGTVETARRLKGIISQTFRYAAQRGLCLHNPAADMRDVLPSTPNNHHASIPLDEFPELLQKMAAYQGDKLTIAAMNLLALTFVRTGELIGARWEEIDLAQAKWNIPASRMKRRKPHVVPLSKQALAIFKEIHTITGHREHVFHSGAAKSNHISNGAILMALRRLGYQGRMTGHGFRALASSILYEKGYMPQAIEAQLAHEDPNEVRSAYNYKAVYMPERSKMMQDYADLLDEMRVNKGNPEKVIQIRKLK